MLDFLADPMVIAGGGTVIGTLGLKAGEKYFSIKKTVPSTKVIPTTGMDTDPEGAAPNDVTRCFMFEIRNTQEKMVSAGIIEETEVSVCDNRDCINCQDTRKAIAMANDSGEGVPLTLHEMSHTNVNHPPMQLPNPVDPRVNNTLGYPVPIPMGVPDRAQVTEAGSEDGWQVYDWTWIDTMSGANMCHKSVAEPNRIHAGTITADKIATGGVKYDREILSAEYDEEVFVDSLVAPVKRIRTSRRAPEITPGVLKKYPNVITPSKYHKMPHFLKKYWLKGMKKGKPVYVKKDHAMKKAKTTGLGRGVPSFEDSGYIWS